MGKRTNTAVWLEKYERWQIKVQKDNERRTFTSSTPGRKGKMECNAKADAWLDDNITNERARVEDLYKEYADSVKETTSYSNWLKVDYFGRIWITPNIGTTRISQINEQKLQDIINQAYAKNLSKKSIQNLKATITAFIKYCRMRRCTTLFPESLQIPKGARTVAKRILQPQSLSILFSTDETTLYGKRIKDKYIHAYRFAVLTGLRPGELRGLMRSDYSNGTIQIKRAVNIHDEITTGKNENALRRIVLSELARSTIEKQLASPNRGDMYIFDINNHASYSKAWKRYCEANKIEYVSLYELRHTFVSVAQSLPDGFLKQIVGHSKSMDTYGVYAHEMVGQLELSAEKLNGLFSDFIYQKQKSN